MVAAHAERDGTAGLHRHAPEDLLDPQPRLHAPNEIVRPDRGAPARHEHVEAEQRSFHRLTMLFLVVGHDSQLGGNGTGRRELGGQHEPVRLVDLAGLERLAPVSGAPSR